jgi:glycosyltransferase involved in cell wall biosynthesis
MGVARPLKVALLTPCFWPEVRRGTERFTRELADGLLSRGHEPHVLTSHPGWPSSRVEGGVRVMRHWRPPAGILERRNFERHLTHVPFTYATLRTGGYDLVQAMFATDARAAARWSKQTGRPSVFSFMGIPTAEGLRQYRGTGRLIRAATSDCSATTALSRAAADGFRRWLDVEARMIHPGVDTEAFRPGHPRSDRPTIFCAADLTEPRKRVPLLVDAFAFVRRERPDARLVLSRPRDRFAASSYEHVPGVEFADVDDRADMARAYGDAWVSALPSLYEAFGLVLAEAMACGTPGVATHDGGMPEVIDREQVGRLFRGDEPQDLAAALLDALELAQAAGTVEACRRRAEELSIDRCVEAHLDLYAELLSR